MILVTKGVRGVNGMFKARFHVAVGVIVVALAVVVSPAYAAQPECKAINQSHDSAYNSNQYVDPLGTAIAEAQPGDTVLVIGTCNGNFVIPKDLTLSGRPSDRQSDVINGGGSGAVLAIAGGTFPHPPISLTVRDLTITDGT